MSEHRRTDRRSRSRPEQSRRRASSKPGEGGGHREQLDDEIAGVHPARIDAGRADDEAPAPQTGGETILLVEDEPAVRQLFAQALSRAGYRVYEARNGQEALKLFDQHGDAIDLLLTDLRMPYMGGAELGEHLRARRRTLKMLAVSGYAGGTESEVAKDFLAKPFSRDDLLAKVREVLDRR